MFDSERDEELRIGDGVVYERSFVIAIVVPECRAVVAAIIAAFTVSKSISILSSNIISIVESYSDVVINAQYDPISLPISATVEQTYHITNIVSVIESFVRTLDATVRFAFYVTIGVSIISSLELTYDIRSFDITEQYPITVSINVTICASNEHSVDSTLPGQHNVRPVGGDRGE